MTRGSRLRTAGSWQDDDLEGDPRKLGSGCTSVSERMFVLGIDPGLSRCGFGLVRRDRSGTTAVAHGVLCTPPDDHIAIRLSAMNAKLRALIAEYRPDVVVVERVFFQTNARTAMGVAQASGLALAAAVDGGCDVEQYTSNEVKQAITGFGASDKATMQRMIARLLGLAEPPKPADAADALALALHHLSMAPYRKTTGATGCTVDTTRIASSVGGAPGVFGRARIATHLAGGLELKGSATEEKGASVK